MSKNSGFVFRRPALASSIADGLVGAGIQDFNPGLSRRRAAPAKAPFCVKT